MRLWTPKPAWVRAGILTTALFTWSLSAACDARTRPEASRLVALNQQTRPASKASGLPGAVIARSNAIVELAGPRTRVALVSVPPAQPAESSLARQVQGLRPEQRIFLRLRDLSTRVAPGVVYQIYLDLSADSDSTEHAEQHLIGSLNFYADVRPPDESGDNASHGSVRTFDVSKRIREMAGRGLLTEDTTVTFIAGGVSDSGAKPRIGSVEIVVE